MVFFRNNHNKKGIARKKNQEGERREGEGRNTKGGKWSQEIRWVGGVSHKISFDSFRKKNKNKKDSNHSPLFSTLKGGNNEEKKRASNKRGDAKGRKRTRLFVFAEKGEWERENGD